MHLCDLWAKDKRVTAFVGLFQQASVSVWPSLELAYCRWGHYYFLYWVPKALKSLPDGQIKYCINVPNHFIGENMALRRGSEDPVHSKLLNFAKSLGKVHHSAVLTKIKRMRFTNQLSQNDWQFYSEIKWLSSNKGVSKLEVSCETVTMPRFFPYSTLCYQKNAHKRTALHPNFRNCKRC